MIETAPADQGDVEVPEVPEMPELGTTRLPQLSSDVALLTVAVPVESATVTVNGRPTTSTGIVRQFMSRGLQEGLEYTYNVHVSYVQDGETKTEDRAIKLRSGLVERLVFDAPVVRNPVETIVQVNVPADAVVVLAGNETVGSGEVRTFRTRQLTEGQSWSDYTVVVRSQIAGQMISKEQTVSVKAGSTTKLTFDFDNAVAKN